jgi:hypothetical protein
MQIVMKFFEMAIKIGKKRRQISKHLYNKHLFTIFDSVIITKPTMNIELKDKEWELIQTIRNFRKMYPQSVEFEIYINHLVTELMYEEQEE